MNRIMNTEYLKIFIDKDYPTFLDDYINTKTMRRLKHVTQFCGCDYTKLYKTLYYFTRFEHSLVVAHMTWHFTHDKEETIIALLHDIGTPCFAHSIDYVFGDYAKQESSEKPIKEMASKDTKLLKLLERDNVSLDKLDDFSSYEILENKSPKLCTDRLDGVLHTAAIWLHTHSFSEIKEVYDDMIVLKNEVGKKEIGFKTITCAEKFFSFVYEYAIALQSNRDIFVMHYISQSVLYCVNKKLITLEDLYNIKEKELVKIFANNIPSWKVFKNAKDIIETEEEPSCFYVSIKSKRRIAIPLVDIDNKAVRVTEISLEANKLYNKINNYKASTYAYVEGIKKDLS